MASVILVIHLLIASAMVGVVLMQKSEGGALGIGGSGGGGGGFLTGRGQANLLTRVTAGLAIGFFATSIALTILGQRTDADESIFDKSGTPAATEKAAPAGEGAPKAKDEEPSGGILDKLK